MTSLRVRRGGAEAPVVLLLHGLGATSDVWDGVVVALGDRAWVAPDLPGHGGSHPLPQYTFSATAEAVADLVDPADTVIIGHSFGGVVGLHLASRPGVRAVVGLGIKVAWTPDELARAAKLAAREPARFDTRDEAVARHLRVAGLDGLVDVDHPAVTAGVVEEDGRWRPALDPRAFGVGEPGVAALLAAASVPVVLARGQHDALVSSADLLELAPNAVDLPGLGHNAHVEDPAAVAALVTRF
ncbi:alpha/beta fold hydrolase [Pseudonocardia alaniniphila]|uniref:Alpha/beta hydrolase n=1 Tax=Pseudonocardia alaniniphila TaxID=75291 RepID=A0ABS9TES3_9PSEU|nr:alpha/beta hydrolase [Pseudonocardia alaniniphila]MCH6167030.1 alpha/beta hydrolase [Pseudonocardia alaniniphila]